MATYCASKHALQVCTWDQTAIKNFCNKREGGITVLKIIMATSHNNIIIFTYFSLKYVKLRLSSSCCISLLPLKWLCHGRLQTVSL